MAEDHWQGLRQGINLLNLLAFYPVAGNAAILEAVDHLLQGSELQGALADLKLLEQRLLDLPENAGPEVCAPDFSELEDGPLKQLLLRLGRLNALYTGKSGTGATTELQQRLGGPSIFDDERSVRLALAHFHRLKS